MTLNIGPWSSGPDANQTRPAANQPLSSVDKIPLPFALSPEIFDVMLLFNRRPKLASGIFICCR